MTVEAIMHWNEPNNLSHWDFQMDPGWSIFAEMVKLASREVRRERPALDRAPGEHRAACLLAADAARESVA